MLAAFTVPALAAKPVTKTYVFTASVDAVDNTQKKTRVHFYVTNTNPDNSNAALGYIQIDLTPVSGMTIVGADGQQLSSTSVVWTLNPKIFPTQTWSGYIDVDGCGLGQAWRSTVTTGLNGSNETFTQTNTRPQVTDVPCASVACGETFTVVGSITQPAGAAVGAYALDGTTTCRSTDSNVYVTDYTSYLNFKWVSSNKLAFYYVLNRGWHHLAWIADANGPIFDAALTDLQCDTTSGAPTTPVPLAAVASDSGSPSKIKVDTTGITTTLTPPFHITAEWMQGTTKRSLYAQVTNISGTPPTQTWTLGSYFPSPRPSIAAGTTIMSTINPPTPATVAGPYIPGSMALLCFKGTVGASAAAIVDSDPEGNGWSSP